MWLIAKRSALRVLFAVVYPMVTVVAVGTANHFFFDLLGGAF